MDTFIRSLFNSEWMFFLFTSIFLLLMAEIGFRAGWGRYRHTDARGKGIGNIDGAVLGLLSLLLGFTFAVAFGRYETRRELVVKEANAIGTTWLRTSMLPEQHRGPIRDLLRRYVDLRVHGHEDMENPGAFDRAMEENTRLQDELWARTETAAHEAPNPVTVLFVNSLNETFDLSSDRLAAGRTFIPGAVSVLLLVMAAVGCFTSNYGLGAFGRRSAQNAVLLPLLISFTILVIFDFVHARQGLIRLSIDPLIELQASMQKTPAHPSA